jgi:DNA repair photolyase
MPREAVTPNIREVNARSILSRSGIEGIQYTVNPYTGCSHGCRYCYATFMKKYTGHTEAWGDFVDVKMNAPELLTKQLARAARGNVILSSVTDPYQAVENRYALTRDCLVALSKHDFPVAILTKSPLVLRDIEVIQRFSDIEVGLTITTDDDRIRAIFEPNAPPIPARFRALQRLHACGIKTYAFVGPTLPMSPQRLAERLGPYVNRVMIDRMNYLSKTTALYRAHRLDQWLDSAYVNSVVDDIRTALGSLPIEVC